MSDLVAKLEDDAHANRQGWRNFLILFGLVVIALGFYIFRDEAPPDDAWMLPKFTHGGEGKNPLAVFIEALKEHPMQGSKEAPNSNQYGDKDKEQAMRDFVQKNGDASRAFDELMKTDPASWCWPGIDEKINFTTSFSGLSECQAVASQLQRMKVEILVRDGHADEAADESLKIIRYGHSLDGVEGTIINYLVAITIEQLGEKALRSALSMPAIGEAKLHKSQDMLMSYDPLPTGLCVALRVEYVMLKSSMDSFKSSLGVASTSGFVPDKQAFLLKYFMQNNRTLKSYLRLQMPIINTFEKDWASIINAVAVQKTVISAWKADLMRFYINPNVGGNMALALSLPTLAVVIEKGAQNSALHRQTIIMIALRRFELEHGKLPDNLDELAPKFLDSVPTDPFDNAPMRWNATDRVVYSIGKDLKDDHGAVSEPRNNKDKDVGMRYWWSVKAE